MKQLLAILLVFFSLATVAHEIRPAYLQIQQESESTFQVFWKVPSRGQAIPKLEVQISESEKLPPIGLPTIQDGFMVFTYPITLETGLEGKQLNIEGLSKTLIDVLVRVEYLSGENITILLQPDNCSTLIPGQTSVTDVVKTYSFLGVEHILFGFDHLLFVLALIILAQGKWKIIKTVTAFTIAHSITLSLASLGLVYIPGAPVEAVIALSIVFLALEILQVQKGKATLTSQKPWLVAFSFGLLHGFGFAGALTDIGIPQQAIPWALAFFNVGVELGQLAFVVVVLAGMTLMQKMKISTPKGNQILAYGIGSIASFWMIERVVNFF
jgi:hydrogenase/urease accessory protein HupE